MKTACLTAAFLAVAAAQPVLSTGPAASASGICCCDAPARWGARHDTDDARIAITTVDGDVTMVLTSKVVALQLSNRCFHKVNRELKRQREDQDNPIAEAIQTVVISGVRALLDHSAECPVVKIRDLSYRDGRLVVVTSKGDHLFDSLEVDDADVLASFSERDAREFVRQFRQLKAGVD